MGIRKTIYGLLNLGAESTVTTQATAVIQSLSGSLALVPSGSGAITANIPDGTVTGGNARGQYAVDLQMSRSAANQVAGRDYSVIAGGQNNSVAGVAAAKWSGILAGRGNSVLGNFDGIISGDANTTNASGSYNVIGGGLGNAVSGTAAYSGVFSGASNNASSNYSTISGGQSNTASTGTHAAVVGGYQNTASGQYSVSGGRENISSGDFSMSFGYLSTASGPASLAIGFRTLASGQQSVALNGGNQVNTTASGAYSLAHGFQGTSYLRSMRTLGNSNSNLQPYNSNAQSSEIVSHRAASLTTAATTVLSLDGTGTTNLIIPDGNNRAWKVKVEWISTVTTITGTATGITVGDMAYGEANFGFKKVSGTSVLGNFINDEGASDSAIMDTCSLGYSVGASQELALTFTGPTFAGGGSVTMRIVAKVSLVEVAY